MAHCTFQAKSAFHFQDLDIHWDQSLGRGSYGAVYKAKCDQLLCAAKVLHPTLVDRTDPGADKTVDRFKKECAFLENIQHPNIVQFLGVARDPDSKLPVLLMELLDESLTKMLERSQLPLAYCVQVDICHDISLAITYLHSIDIIHRDLSSNNVLIIAGRRVKVTDFGMSKLAVASPGSTPLTTCPGMQFFMPPEALEEQPIYSKKLDCFSEGVLMIQVCTGLWPDPGPRAKRVQDENSPTGVVDFPVPETERRKNHIDMIRRNHPLLPIAKKCLEYRDEARPSSEQVCQELADLKECMEYHESKQNYVDDIQAKDNQITFLAQQLQEKDRALEVKFNQLQQCQQQLQKLKIVIAEIQLTNQSLHRQVEQLQQQQNQQCLIPGRTPRHSLVNCKPHLKLTWKQGSKAPVKICRGATVVNGSVAYFMHSGGKVCSYNSESKVWHELTKCPYEYSSLAIVNGLLIAIGGCLNMRNCDTYSDKLLRLPNYTEAFPPMQTKRWNTTTVTLGDTLIVAGGRVGPRNCDCISTVEVMNSKTWTWSKVASLPHPYATVSATICGNRVYMLGGSDDKDKTKSVLTCSLTELLKSSSSTLSVWERIADAPAYNSTCACVNEELLIFGGYNNSDGCRIPTADIYMYNLTTNTWDLISKMLTRKFLGCVAVLPPNEVMVVGGIDSEQHCDTQQVDVATYVYA